MRNGTSGDARNGDLLQFTPNGTKIPAGPPPSDDGNVTPVPPPVPPLPMMPMELAMETDVKVNLEAYEAFKEMGSKGKLGDVMWKPSDEKLLTPQEAKAKWLELEREVQSLKTVLNKVAEGSSYDISTAWPLKPGQTVWNAELPNPTLLEQPGAEHGEQGQGDQALHGTVLGDLPQQARVLQPGMLSRGALHSRVLGKEFQQARAHAWHCCWRSAST